MNEKIAEQLSALMDNELSQHEYDLLLRRIEQEPELQAAWSRYQLIGDVMRNDHNLVPAAGFLDGIHKQIESEPAVTAAAMMPAKQARWLRPVAGLAIAASVAMFSIIGIQNVSNSGPDGAQTPVLAQSAVADQGLRRVSGTHWNMTQPEMEQRLNSYLVNHSEYASGNSLQGIINYARIAGYDAQRKK